jgi:DNA-binding FadR family transcriptional regulator
MTAARVLPQMDPLMVDPALADRPPTADGHPVADPFEPLRLRSAGEQVADRLMTAIALGEFVEGQRLPPERELAAMLRVSRTTVREAVALLVAAGQAEVRRGRQGGAYVLSDRSPDSDAAVRRTLTAGWPQLEQLLDLRSLVEPLIARTAAQRRRPADVSRIRAALEAYRDAPDRAASSAADGRFHATIAEATGNPLLVSLSDRIRQAVSLGFRAEPFTPAIRERAIREHGLLARAVIAGRGGLAADVARTHFSITEEVLRSLFERTQAGVP